MTIDLVTQRLRSLDYSNDEEVTHNPKHCPNAVVNAIGLLITKLESK